MDNTSITYLVSACAGVFGLVAYVGLILVPAWGSYTRMWEKLSAAFLSLYVLATFLGIGLVGGLAVIWFYDRIV